MSKSACRKKRMAPGCTRKPRWNRRWPWCGGCFRVEEVCSLIGRERVPVSQRPWLSQRQLLAGRTPAGTHCYLSSLLASHFLPQELVGFLNQSKSSHDISTQRNDLMNQPHLISAYNRTNITCRKLNVNQCSRMLSHSSGTVLQTKRIKIDSLVWSYYRLKITKSRISIMETPHIKSQTF